MTKMEFAKKITDKLDEIKRKMMNGEMTPAQQMDAKRDLFNAIQKESGYADGVMAQVWQKGCRAHNIKAYGWTMASEF